MTAFMLHYCNQILIHPNRAANHTTFSSTTSVFGNDHQLSLLHVPHVKLKMADKASLLKSLEASTAKDIGTLVTAVCFDNRPVV